METREQLKTLFKTIAKELRLAFDPKIHVTASIGVSEYPVDGTEYEYLMRKADKALYLAKEKQNRHIIYEERTAEGWRPTICRTWLWPVVSMRKTGSHHRYDHKMCVSGGEFHCENEERLQQIRSLFDLDGITIFRVSSAAGMPKR